jgi:hypothetical protein
MLQEDCALIEEPQIRSREKIIESCKCMFEDRGYINIDISALEDRLILPKKHSVNSHFEHLMSAFDEKRNEQVRIYITTLQRAGLSQIKDFRNKVILQNVTHCILISYDSISNSAIKNLKSNSSIDYIVKRNVTEMNDYLQRKDYDLNSTNEFLEGVLTNFKEEGIVVSTSLFAKLIRIHIPTSWLPQISAIPLPMNGTVSFQLHQSMDRKKKLRQSLIVSITTNDLEESTKDEFQLQFAPYLRRLKTEIERINIIVDKNPVESVIFFIQNPQLASLFDYTFITQCPSIHFETFTYDELCWPVARAKCQPSFHVVEDDEEFNAWADIFGFRNKAQLHRKFKKDPIVKYHDWPVGTTVRTVRRLGTLDPFLSFSTVTEPKEY